MTESAIAIIVVGAVCAVAGWHIGYITAVRKCMRIVAEARVTTLRSVK